MIEIIKISKIYKMGEVRVAALDGISLTIQQHEFAAILGPSGSGKSTLMNIIGCLDAATEGIYRLDGQDVSTYNDNQLAEFRNRKIGFIFQGFNLLPRFNALENVELPLIYMGMGGRQRREKAIQALQSVGLIDRMHHRPSELSGGQQQRVAIARALVTNPPLILADEPTGNLDSKSGAEVLGILNNLYESGNTIVLITHDMEVAKNARRLIHIQDGKIDSDQEVTAI